MTDRHFWTLGALLALGVLPRPASAQGLGHCRFDVSRLEFRGSPVEQARCLLSPLARKGVVGAAPAQLGQVLESRVGRPAQIDRAAFTALLRRERLDSVADRLDRPSRGQPQA